MSPKNYSRSTKAAIRLFAAFTLSNLLLADMPSAYGADEVHDEIQVYNAGIAAIGQWTHEQHLNYAAIGQGSMYKI